MPEVTAGGVQTIDIPSAVTEKYTVTGDTQITSDSDVYMPMKDMIITVQPTMQCGALVLFSGTIMSGSWDNALEMAIALHMDNDRIATTLVRPVAEDVIIGNPEGYHYTVRRQGYNNATLITAVPELAPGQHTFQMYFRGNKFLLERDSLHVRQRSLTVIMFYR